MSFWNCATPVLSLRGRRKVGTYGHLDRNRARSLPPCSPLGVRGSREPRDETDSEDGVLHTTSRTESDSHFPLCHHLPRRCIHYLCTSHGWVFFSPHYVSLSSFLLRLPPPSSSSSSAAEVETWTELSQDCSHLCPPQWLLWWVVGSSTGPPWKLSFLESSAGPPWRLSLLGSSTGPPWRPSLPGSSTDPPRLISCHPLALTWHELT